MLLYSLVTVPRVPSDCDPNGWERYCRRTGEDLDNIPALDRWIASSPVGGAIGAMAWTTADATTAGHKASVYVVDDSPQTVNDLQWERTEAETSFCRVDEATLLHWFFDTAAMQSPLVAWTARSFTGPFVAARGAVHGLTPTFNPAPYRFDFGTILDLHEITSCFGAARFHGGLFAWAETAGFVVPPSLEQLADFRGDIHTLSNENLADMAALRLGATSKVAETFLRNAGALKKK